jgi:hypothetical protein
VNNDITMNAGSHLAIEISGTSADKLVVGGNFDLSAAEYLDVTGSGTGPWVFATYRGTLSGTFDNVTSGYSVDYSTPGQLILNAVPEPGTSSLFALVVVGFGVSRGRHRGGRFCRPVGA